VAFEQRFAASLPFGACVGVSLPEKADDEAGWPATLHPDERAVARSLGEARRASWIGGRVALRAALETAGLPAADALLATARGGPRLPAGAAGSISHKGDLVVAMAAPAGQPAATLGVDLEQLRPLRADLAARVLTPGEREGLPPPGPDREAHLLRVFCAKEAVYKALDPWLARYVGFHEVEIGFEAGGLTVLPRLAAGEGPFVVQLDQRDLAGSGWILIAARACRT
jgi:enterobactin synthetase component D / holo-[acyl-carrier protein] synthase